MDIYKDKQIMLIADEENVYITNFRYSKEELFYFCKEMSLNCFRQVSEEVNIPVLDSGKLDLESLNDTVDLDEIINYEIENNDKKNESLVKVIGIKNSKFMNIMLKDNEDSKIIEYNGLEDVINDFCFWLEDENRDVLTNKEKIYLANLYFGLYKFEMVEKFSIDLVKKCNNGLNIDIGKAKENYQLIKNLQEQGVKVFRK